MNEKIEFLKMREEKLFEKETRDKRREGKKGKALKESDETIKR